MDEMPCVQNCPDRSATCHATCGKYKKWRRARDKYLDEKALKAEVFEVIIGSVERTKKKMRRR